MQPGRARRDDEGHEVRDVLDLAVAHDAGLSAEPLADFLLRLAGALDLGADAPPLPLGLDQAGMYAIDPHPVLLAEVGEAFGEGGDRGVDRAADGEALLRLAPAGAADRHQRAAALLEQRPGCAREPHMGEEFQRVALLPIGVGEREEIAAPGGAGIVDEDVEMAELASRGRDQRGRSGGVAQVERAYRGLAALAADRRRDFVERRGVAAGQQQIAAFIGKRQRYAAANAAARSGYQRDLSLQPELHAPLLMRASA